MDPSQVRSSYNPLLVVVVVIAVIIIGGLIVVVSRNNNLGNFGLQLTSADILYITSPVYSFTGTVDKVNADSIVISNNLTTGAVNIVPVANPNPSSSPKSQSKKVSYIVKVGKQTSIFQQSNPQLTLSPVASPTATIPPKLTISSIKVGDVVNVQSSSDLRTLVDNQFDAVSVSIAPMINNISGQVSAISGNVMTVHGFALQPLGMAGNITTPSSKDYQVTVSASTEITTTRFGTDPLKPQVTKLSLSELKKDSQVMVFSSVDVVKNTQFQATRVEVLSGGPVAGNVPPLPASGSAIPAGKVSSPPAP